MRKYLIRVALLCGAVLLTWQVFVPVSSGGRTAYVYTHGISMAPRFQTGDLAVLRVANSYRVGEVAAYHSHLLHTVVMHRIVAKADGRYTFKGDNNEFLDPERPRPDQLIGTLAFRLPRGGLWLQRLTSPAALALIAAALFVGGTASQTTRKRRRRMSRHAARPLDTTHGIRSLPIAATGLAAAAVLAILGVGLGAVAWTQPTERLTNTNRKATQQVTFSYRAHVARSPAYDGATVRSPEPVFRRLARTVDISVVYHGKPGAMVVVTELSTASGWHSTMPLSAPRTFGTSTYQQSVRLDLDSLQARANAAAEATGIPAGEVHVAVTPRVTTARQPEFTPALQLVLTPLELRLADRDTSLQIKQATPVPTRVHTAVVLHLAGRQASVATARTAAIVWLAMAALLAALFLMAARWSARIDEGVLIRRRYAPLLIPVRPMPTPAGWVIVEVRDFATLAKLANRYGLLVMHWSRSGVDTYVVQDEGTTYRYRTGSAHPSRDCPTEEVEGSLVQADDSTPHDQLT